jgi:DNA-binding XRE family transcriptional regulator
VIADQITALRAAAGGMSQEELAGRIGVTRP